MIRRNEPVKITTGLNGFHGLSTNNNFNLTNVFYQRAEKVFNSFSRFDKNGLLDD